MERIYLTSGNTGAPAAFDARKMSDTLVNEGVLLDLLARNLGHFAQLLTDGCGFGITIKDGRAEVFGIKMSDTEAAGQE